MDKTSATIKLTESEAAVLGAVAFARGIGRAPALDPEFAALEPLQIGDPRGMARLRGWLRGWDAANLAAFASIVARAEAASARACSARASLPAGSSRARVTSANARGAAAGMAYTVRLAPEEVSEIVAVLRQGEKIVGLLREGGIALARRRAARAARGGR